MKSPAEVEVMATVTCPSCRRQLRVPDQLAERLLICPGCNEAVPAPNPEAEYLQLVKHASPPQGPARSTAGEELLSFPERLGAVAMLLGVLSVLVLCLPYVGYAALGLSAVGLLVGLWGLASAYLSGAHFGGIRQPEKSYPLGGVAACLLALALALFPFLLS
jgi:hypothetical protein